MRFLKFFSLGYWLKSKSISQRLGFQAGSAILLSFCLVAVLAGGSYVSLGMIQKDNDLAGQALSSALLEKDFASLERDVFRYALLQNEETKAGPVLSGTKFLAAEHQISGSGGPNFWQRGGKFLTTRG